MFIQTAFHINYPLIPGASESKAYIFLFFYVRSVDQHINKTQKLQPAFILLSHKILKGKPGVAHNIYISSLELLRNMYEGVSLKEWLSSGELSIS